MLSFANNMCVVHQDQGSHFSFSSGVKQEEERAGVAQLSSEDKNLISGFNSALKSYQPGGLSMIVQCLQARLYNIYSSCTVCIAQFSIMQFMGVF